MPKHEPERTCIVRRETANPADLIRFVLGPDATVVPDLRHKLPGRGVWVTADRATVQEAVRRRLFARAFKAEAKVPPSLAEDIDAALLRDVTGALALANKAGAVTSGFAKVEAACRKGEVSALLHASEAAPDGRRKLAGALHKGTEGTISVIPVLDDLAGDELGVALGRVHVVHAAILAGAGGAGCLARWRRLRRYRGLGDAETPLRNETSLRTVDGQASAIAEPERQD